MQKRVQKLVSKLTATTDTDFGAKSPDAWFFPVARLMFYTCIQFTRLLVIFKFKLGFP